jgi:tyrosinase
MTRTRKDVGLLPPGDETLLWYARAVARMQALPLNDPLGWRYQAAIHEYRDGADPLANPGDVFPANADRNRFWNQCQHNSWFFLPWHRMYLLHFERIVARHVVELGGPAEWALPYWNYSRDANARLLPAAFRNPTMADGTANPLYVEERHPLANQGRQFADPFDADPSFALNETDFSGTGFGDASGFGGPQTDFNHGGGPSGMIDNVPHGAMHVAIAGGPGGWMGGFNTAALDPIFWLHHANIDRLWEVWLRQPGRRNPVQARWLRDTRFDFNAADGSVVTMIAESVLDTTAPPLDYFYEDPGVPIAIETPALVLEETMPEKVPPELVAATTESIELDNAPADATLTGPPGQHLPMAGPLDEAAGPAPRVYLNLENLTATQRAPSYDVYLNIPAGHDPATHPERFVGRLSLFGVEEATRQTARHAGSGATYAFEITELYNRLSREPGWRNDALRVAFVPARAWKGGAVKVGRVSLYFG